jgi:hypothetical protein
MIRMRTYVKVVDHITSEHTVTTFACVLVREVAQLAIDN